MLILGFYLISLFQLVQGGILNSEHVFRLWGIVVVLATIGTVTIIIFTHIASNVIHTIKTNKESHLKDIQDERDKLIELKGTNVAYRVSSIGVALSMLTLVLGQPPLVMFSLLIFSGIVAQISADLRRLYLYRRGF
jgi:hypothetical protein